MQMQTGLHFFVLIDALFPNLQIFTHIRMLSLLTSTKVSGVVFDCIDS